MRNKRPFTSQDDRTILALRATGSVNIARCLRRNKKAIDRRLKFLASRQGSRGHKKHINKLRLIDE